MAPSSSLVDIEVIEVQIPGPQGPAGAGALRIDVTRYGARDTGDPADAIINRQAFRDAYAAARAENIRRIYFPRVTKGEYCVSAEAYDPLVDFPVFEIDIADFDGIKLHGPDRHLVTIIQTWTPPTDLSNAIISPFLHLTDCSEAVVSDLGFDVRPRPYTQGTISAVNANHLDFIPDAGYEPAFRSCDVVNGFAPDMSGLIGRNRSPELTGNPFALYEVSGGAWRVDFTTAEIPPTLDTLWPGAAYIPAVGMPIIVAFRRHGNFILWGNRTEQLRLERLRVYSSSWGLFFGKENHDLTVNDLIMRGHPGDLFCSNTAFNTVHGRGVARLFNCDIEGLGDDFFNHHTYTWVGTPITDGNERIIAAGNEVSAYFSNDSLGFGDIPAPRVGDIIEFWPPDISQGRTKRIVVSVADPGGVDIHPVQIVLDDDIPVGFDAETWSVFNRSQDQAIRAQGISSKYSVGRVFLLNGEDAELDNITAEGNLNEPINGRFPNKDVTTTGVGRAGYAGGFSIQNFSFKNCGRNKVDAQGGSGIYGFLGTYPLIEPTGPLPDAKPVYIGKGYQDGTYFGGVTFVGHDVVIDGLVQRNIGTNRTGLSSEDTTQDGNDLYVSAGTLTRGDYVNVNDGPVFVTDTGSIVDKLLTKAKAMRGLIEEETAAFIEKFQIAPRRDRTFLYDDLIIALKATGEWAKIKGLFILAAADADAALRCAVGPLLKGVAYGSPTFTSDRGYTGNAISAYIDTLLPWSVVGQDDVFALVWTRDELELTGDYPLGVFNPNGAGATALRINPRDDLGRLVTNANDGTASATADASSIGSFGLVRSASGSYGQYANGSRVATINVASSVAPVSLDNFGILRASSFYSAREVAVAMFGRAPANADAFMSSVHSAFHTFLVAIGAAS